MIPYDDLVAALSAWRIKKGLPVAEEAVALAQLAPPAPPPRTTAPRTAPPMAPPPPLAAEEPLDVDASLIEETALGESDYAYGFGTQADGEATSIGEVPEPPDRNTRRDDQDW